MKEIMGCQKNCEGGEWLNNYLSILENSCEDFSEVKTSYEKSCLEIKKKYNDIESVIEYNNAMMISNIEFSFKQGLNDNLNHFKNPQKATFMDNDYNETLNEKEMRSRSEYVNALKERDKLLWLLPQGLLRLYDAVVEYYIFLDTYIPKIAHYYGFISGNKVLEQAIENYSPDLKLSKAYKEWINDYLKLDL